MAQENYYLITALPGLDELGAAAPMKRSDLLSHVADQADVRDLIEAVFLSDDLLQRQAFAAKEIIETDPTVLTDGQIRGEDPLPDYLTAEESQPSSGLAEDQLWKRYYYHVVRVARQCGNSFLQQWVSYEVGLRNALATARAQSLQLEADPYLVAAELADTDEDFNPMINEWSAAGTPLDGLKVLDRARWNWLGERENWFSFDNDELVVYAVRLMLLWRWQRLDQSQTKLT